MSEKVTYKEACELIAKWLNEVKFVNRTDWTRVEIFNTSPTGELFHVYQYYELAKEYFGIKSETVIPKNPSVGTFYRDYQENEYKVWTGKEWAVMP